MDFSYEFLMFQHGNHDTKEKLEYYPSFIMILLRELKTLREGLCTSCQQKCASSRTTRSGHQSFATATDSTIPMRLITPTNVDIPTSGRVPETDVLWRTPAAGYSPIDEKITSDSSSLSTERRNGNESDDPIFYAERDPLADSTIDCTFIHSFRHKNFVICVCFSRDGRYMAVGTGLIGDTSIFIYEVENRKKYRELREYATKYRSYIRPLAWNLCFSTNGRYLAVADVIGRIIIWDIPNKRMRSIFQWDEWISAVCFSPNGSLLSFVTDAGLVLVNMRDNSRRMVSESSCFDFSPGGRLIATRRNGFLVILGMRTGKSVKRWNGHGSELRRVKFTLDGRRLLCVYEDMIEQWDVNDSVPVLFRKFEIQSLYLTCAVSPDHRLLGFDNQLWDVKSGKRQYTFKGHNSFIHSVDFSTAGTYMAVGGPDGFVSLWKYNRT